MSTRCHILVKEGREEYKIYHHSDGYPEGVGTDLKEFLKEINKNYWYAEDIANALIKGRIKVPGVIGWAEDNKPQYGFKSDDGYEITSCIHGDEEYVYIIDCREKTLTCYKMDWDDSLEETLAKNRVEEIPDREKKE